MEITSEKRKEKKACTLVIQVMVDGVMINKPVVTIDGLVDFGSWSNR